MGRPRTATAKEWVLLNGLPPHNLDAEVSVIGAAIVDGGALQQTIHALDEADFYAAKHGLIWRAIRTLHGRREPVDAVTLTDELRRMGELAHVGGGPYIARLINEVPTTNNASMYADMVRGAAIRRRVGQQTSELVKAQYDDSLTADEYLAKVSAVLSSALAERRRAQGGPRDLTDLLDWVQTRYDGQDSGEDPADARRTLTGYDVIDDMFPLMAGDLVVIGALPSVGKTQVGKFLAESVAGRNQRTLFFSVEMQRKRMYSRLLATRSNINLQTVRLGRMADGQWETAFQAAADLVTMPLYIDDTPERTTEDIYAESLRFAAEKGPPHLIVVDYLQYLSDRPQGKQSRWELVGDMCRRLRLVAKELSCPMVVLSQLNREADDASHLPQMSHLAQSSDIERHSDMIWLLHRPELYDLEDTRWTDKLLVIVAKQRDGPKGWFWMHNNKATGRLTSIPRQDWPPLPGKDRAK